MPTGHLPHRPSATCVFFLGYVQAELAAAAERLALHRNLFLDGEQVGEATS